MNHMQFLYIKLITLLFIKNMVLFDFNKDVELTQWRIVDDVVMGGRSDGHFGISAAGHGVFQGKVSLENNGGFSSVRYWFDQKNVERYERVKIRLKGDGKQYQFRVKSDQRDRFSYIYEFNTSSEWELIEIPFSEMVPGFRGRPLNIPNYDGKQLAEIAFLISNKVPESFRLEIDNITLE